MSFMEYQVLGYESPLYGRRTAQFKIEALNYKEIAAFCPTLSPEQLSLVYGITGGIPHYINKLGVNDDIVMCGGVAQNPGAVDAIRKQLNKPVIVAQNPQVTGALGAALFAYENVKWLPED